MITGVLIVCRSYGSRGRHQHFKLNRRGNAEIYIISGIVFASYLVMFD